MKANSSTIGGAVWKMGSKTIVDVSQIEETIKNIPADSFTVLDFIEAFRKVYPEDWGRLVERFGLFGSKRRYTVATYFSNRVDVYSQKPHSILLPFIRYKEGKFKDYRRTTEDEREACKNTMKRTATNSPIILTRRFLKPALPQPNFTIFHHSYANYLEFTF